MKMMCAARSSRPSQIVFHPSTPLAHYARRMADRRPSLRPSTLLLTDGSALVNENGAEGKRLVSA